LEEWRLEKIQLIGVENDGLNMAADEQFLYIRCKRAMYKYDITDMSLTAHNVIFRKDGKARNFSVCDAYVFLIDFCDLYLLDKSDLRVAEVIRLGTDLSSDLGAVRFGPQKAYISIRNGKMAAIDMATRDIGKFDISDSSFWDHCVAGNRIYAGTVKGELLEIDTNDMQVIKKIMLGKKNIYSVVLSGRLIYTVSQDMTIKAVHADSFETVCTAKKAVSGMARILGVHNDTLVVADSNKITLWDKQTLQFREKIEMPTGSYNKGAILHGNRLFGSDYQSVYSCVL
jgi:hypothetical protein